MKKTTLLLSAALSFMSFSTMAQDNPTTLPPSLSGIYPSLAYVNDEGECGTGAVVPWADRLWIVTYGPHSPFGSNDKLYEITPSLQITPRMESVGGTHANRFIHRKTGQLVIGPYLVDSQRNMRAISPNVMPGRLTGTCMSLSDSANKVMMATMEQGFYEVDVNTLNVNTISPDGNLLHREGAPTINGSLCKGVHGKGFYSGQGVYVYANNGEDSDEALKNPTIESGSLSEYDGKEWHLIRRNQFTEVTGPSGVYGPSHPDTDPIWSMGWDSKSLILAVRSKQRGWEFFRLPKASHAYDGAHGWNTEWPRIRDVGEWSGKNLLMTMHGMFWQFPASFTATSSAGIRPLSAYLKVIGDFAKWNSHIVFGCDDTAKNQFLNHRSQKGDVPAPGRSCSNLWFTTLSDISHLGATTADGAVWQNEQVEAGVPSEPMLIGGWRHRQAWISNKGTQRTQYTFEIDKKGDGTWTPLTTVSVDGGCSMQMMLKNTKAEWIRVVTEKPTTTTVMFTFAAEPMSDAARKKYQLRSTQLFKGLATTSSRTSIGGKLLSLDGDTRRMAVLVENTMLGNTTPSGCYTLDASLTLSRESLLTSDKQLRDRLSTKTTGATVDSLSILITDDSGRRWRLPIADDYLAQLSSEGQTRICREVVTERDLFNFGGTFFELPAENAGGFAMIRPIASHHYRIGDYASFCGLLIMTGIDTETTGNPHIIRSTDKHSAVWAGAIDDLWMMGQPMGHGSLWRHTHIHAKEYSDPFLVGFYEQKTIKLTNHSTHPVTFTIEADPNGSGEWMTCEEITVKGGKRESHTFPASFQARWLRVCADADVVATVDVDCNYRQPRQLDPLPDNPSLIGRGVMVVTPNNSYSNVPGARR